MENYFCGWYWKFQNETQTMALIPAYHIAGGEKSCSIQLITDDGAWNVPFDFSAYREYKGRLQIGNNVFTRRGVALELHGPGLEASGSVTFGPFAPIRYDIMGPFRYVPFMECRHSVISMAHRVTGVLQINHVPYIFSNGLGYLEGDRGRSFPENYLWSQCCFSEGSVMVSVAKIPFWGVHFTGIIALIYYKGREYRLATYLGARVVQLRDGQAVIRQGSRVLMVRWLEKKGYPLAAPVDGNMSRIIHETAACKTQYRFLEKGRTIFDITSSRAGFEYEYPQ